MSFCRTVVRSLLCVTARSLAHLGELSTESCHLIMQENFAFENRVTKAKTGLAIELHNRIANKEAEIVRLHPEMESIREQIETQAACKEEEVAEYQENMQEFKTEVEAAKHCEEKNAEFVAEKSPLDAKLSKIFKN